MAVRIINDNERLHIDIEGARFFFRRLPAHVRASIIEQYTDKRSGVQDWVKISIAYLQHCLYGWERVIDGHGEALPFSTEIIKYLPDTVQSELVEIVGKNTDQLDDEVKNSSITPSSNLETMD
jgi:hypothetical protein